MTIWVSMAVTYWVNGTRLQIDVPGYGQSRKAAKKDGYRRACSKLFQLYPNAHYRIESAKPTKFEEVDGAHEDGA